MCYEDDQGCKWVIEYGYPTVGFLICPKMYKFKGCGFYMFYVCVVFVMYACVRHLHVNAGDFRYIINLYYGEFRTNGTS